jgi:hypothetical protein
LEVIANLFAKIKEICMNYGKGKKKGGGKKGK